MRWLPYSPKSLPVTLSWQSARISTPINNLHSNPVRKRSNTIIATLISVLIYIRALEIPPTFYSTLRTQPERSRTFGMLQHSGRLIYCTCDLGQPIKCGESPSVLSNTSHARDDGRRTIPRHHWLKSQPPLMERVNRGKITLRFDFGMSTAECDAHPSRRCHTTIGSEFSMGSFVGQIPIDFGDYREAHQHVLVLSILKGNDVYNDVYSGIK